MRSAAGHRGDPSPRPRRLGLASTGLLLGYRIGRLVPRLFLEGPDVSRLEPRKRLFSRVTALPPLHVGDDDPEDPPSDPGSDAVSPPVLRRRSPVLRLGSPVLLCPEERLGQEDATDYVVLPWARTVFIEVEPVRCRISAKPEAPYFSPHAYQARLIRRSEELIDLSNRGRRRTGIW